MLIVGDLQGDAPHDGAADALPLEGWGGGGGAVAMAPMYLINVARGPIMDEEAPVKALQHGRISSTGLDVCGREPLPIDHPLTALENVVLTPHRSVG